MRRLRKVAIVGANKDGLALLPYLLNDKDTKVEMITDNNKDAMAFKLEELGYKISDRYGIKLTPNLSDLLKIDDLDIIINASKDPSITSFLYQPRFSKVEILTPLSARLLWGYKKEGKLFGQSTSRDRHQGLLESLAEIVDAVKLTLDKDELLPIILRIALDATGAERGSIMLLGDDQNLRVEVAEGMEEEIVRKIKTPIGEGIAGYVAKEGKPIMITGRAEDERYRKIMERTDVKSAMSVPLRLDGRVIGVLNVSSNISTHAFTQDDLNFLNKLAVFAAEIIQRSREFEDMRHTSIKFERWKDIETILRSDKPLEERLKQVCDSLSLFIPNLTCSIFLFDEYSKKLYIRASSTMSLRDRGGYRIGLNHGINGWVAKEKKAALLTDRDMLSPGFPRKFFIALPLVADNTLVGIMEAQLVSPIGLLPYQESFLKELTGPISETIRESLKDKKTYIRSTKLAVINEIGLEIVTTSDGERLPHMIASSAAVIMDAGGALLRLKEGAGFKVKAIHGLDEEDRRHVISIEKELSRETIKTRKPITRVIDTPDRSRSGGITSVLTYPLRKGSGLIGILTLFDKIGEYTFAPSPFTRDDVELLERFIRYSEKALINADLEEKVEELKEIIPPIDRKEYFEKRLKEELNRARRYGRRLLLLYIYVPEKGDIDSFMIQLKAKVERKVRGFDVVERVDRCKLGVLFPDSDEGALRLIEQIPRWIEEGIALKYGYAVYPDDAVDFDTIVSKASTPV